MAVLYIDNFRGFEKTYLRLEEVNFFVGENSTGKTSILKLIGILSSAGFWNYKQFSNGEIDLGSFSEIVTYNSGKEFFDIAILEVESQISAIKLKFINENNIPTIKEVSVINDRINIQATVDGKFLKYRYSTDACLLNNEDVNFKFSSWLNSNGLNNIPFEREEIEFLGIKSILFQLQTKVNTEISDFDGKITFGIPSFLNNLAWTAPIRTEPKKTYDSHLFSFTPEGIHAPYILNELLNQDNDVLSILTRFGNDSGLYDNISVNQLFNDSKKLSPFEILITLNDKPLNISNVGYGVSQILPLLVEILARPQGTWFAIQQPEIHLHPRAQAAFGDFIYKSNINDRQKLIVETHSDYTIDRYRLRLNRYFRETDEKDVKVSAQVIFFSRNDKGNNLLAIPINADGSYPEDQPKEFRDFFIKEQLNLITI